MKLNLKLLRRDLARLTVRHSSFGNNEIKETKKESKIKRVLYQAVVKTGAKVGDVADYTLKQILKMTIRYLGPIFLSAVLFRYRTNIYELLIKKSDREMINNKTAGISKVAGRLNKGLETVTEAADKIKGLPNFTKP